MAKVIIEDCPGIEQLKTMNVFIEIVELTKGIKLKKLFTLFLVIRDAHNLKCYMGGLAKTSYSLWCR